jgi:glyoxylase-like metal-dependent hydrolase (beta-lactamase superfamily II)
MQRYSIEAIVSAPFDEVCYIIWLNGRNDAIVVDPSFDTRSVIASLKRHDLTVSAIVNTHGHIDHIAGNRAIKQAYPDAPLIIGRNETHLLESPEANLSGHFGLPVTSPAADRLLSDLEEIEIAGLRFLVREIPGHSPGSVVYYCDQFDPPFVLGGDVLFAGSVGRTDLGGDLNLLLTGIREKLFALPDSTLVYPGHGPSTTVGHERRSNPFVGSSAHTGLTTEAS